MTSILITPKNDNCLPVHVRISRESFDTLKFLNGHESDEELINSFQSHIDSFSKSPRGLMPMLRNQYEQEMDFFVEWLYSGWAKQAGYWAAEPNMRLRTARPLR